MKKDVTSQTLSSTDTGRSMVEMLGTLAIVGVLSIAGIAGYRYAMDKYRANETIDKYRANETMDELNIRAVMYATQVLDTPLQSGKILNNGEFGDKTALGYDIEANKSYYPDEFEVTLSNYPSEVCRDILKNYTIPYQIVVAGKVYDPKSDNYSICGEDGEGAPETLFVYTADLKQKKEGLDSKFTTYGITAACTSGIGFPSLGRSYPCESEGAYYISSQAEYDLCRACGRRMVGGYCIPGCMARQVYHNGKKQCITPECVTNSDCGSGKYCKLDSSQNGNSCREAPTYGTCESASGTPVTVDGVGTYQKSGSKMNWWSAQNYCQAIGGSMVSLSAFGCADEAEILSRSGGYCNAVAGNRISSSQTKSDVIQAFQTIFGKSNDYWTSDLYGACYAYLVSLAYGYVASYSRYGSSRHRNYYALCRVGD